MQTHLQHGLADTFEVEWQHAPRTNIGAVSRYLKLRTAVRCCHLLNTCIGILVEGLVVDDIRVMIPTIGWAGGLVDIVLHLKALVVVALALLPARVDIIGIDDDCKDDIVGRLVVEYHGHISFARTRLGIIDASTL